MRKRIFVMLLAAALAVGMMVSCDDTLWDPPVEEPPVVVPPVEEPFVPPEGALTSAETVVAADEDTALEIEGTAKVTFAQGVLPAGGKATLFCESAGFPQAGAEGAVWETKLGLVVDGKEVKDFGENKVDVEIHTLKGLTAPTIDGATDVVYDAETGALTFKAGALGAFVVADANVAAVNLEAEKAYGDAWTENGVWIPTKEAKDGETVVLVKDLEVANSRRIQVLEKAVLDMNEHKVSKKFENPDAEDFDPVFILVYGDNGDLTVKNGTVEGEAATQYNVFLVHEGSALTIESGTYKCADNMYLVYVMKNAELTVNGGTLVAEGLDSCAIGTNGTEEGSAITITGGEIKGSNYFPGGGTYTITGGTFENAGTCVYQKAGTLDISGGSFTATGDGHNHFVHRGSGYDLTNDAVVVEACGYPNAQPPTIKVTGGTFTGHHAEGANNNGILLLELKKGDAEEYYAIDATGIDEAHQADCRKARATGDERALFADDETKAFGENWE